eukprot:1448912-Rhodomonas_salina.2
MADASDKSASISASSSSNRSQCARSVPRTLEAEHPRAASQDEFRRAEPWRNTGTPNTLGYNRCK